MSLIDDLPKSEKKNVALDYASILKILPHRYPFLLVDAVKEYELGKTLVGLKNVSFNEPFFQGHFPSDPVMPGVLQVEAMAQTGAILMYLSYEKENVGKRPAFMGVDACRFRRPVRPGDTLEIRTEIIKYRRGIGTLQGQILVDGDVACDAQIMAMMV